MVTATVIDVLVALAFAALGIFFGMTGCLAVLVLGLVGLVMGVRRQERTGPTRNPLGGHWRRWAICVLAYASFVLILAPWAEWPAVAIALILFSPLFGSLACVVGLAIRAS